MEAAVFVTNRFPTLGICSARLALVNVLSVKRQLEALIVLVLPVLRVGTGMGMEIAHARTRNTSLAGRLPTLCGQLLR